MGRPAKHLLRGGVEVQQLELHVVGRLRSRWIRDAPHDPRSQLQLARVIRKHQAKLHPGIRSDLLGARDDQAAVDEALVELAAKDLP